MSPESPSLLTEPIVNRYRRRKLGRTFWLIVLALVLSSLLLVFLRLWMLLDLPWVKSPPLTRGDGWTCLKGVVGVYLPRGEAKDWLDRSIQNAFEAKMDFVGVIHPMPSSLESAAQDAPLAVLLGQSLEHEGGSAMAFALPNPLGPDEQSSISLFRIIRHLKGWGVLNPEAYPSDFGKQWQGHEPDAVLLLPAAQEAPLSFSDKLMSFLGVLFDERAAMLQLAPRPTAQLAAWDAIGRSRHTLGLCGLGRDDSLDGKGQPLSFVLVKAGLGPYGSKAVLEALRAGHHFCALSALGDASGFRFHLADLNTKKVLGIMGDTLPLPESECELVVDLGLKLVPAGLHIHLLVDGIEVARSTESQLRHKVERAGAYRVEVGIVRGDFPWGQSERMWIYSNPILLREN